VVSQAGGVLLGETVGKTGRETVISQAVEPWRKLGTVQVDVAVAVAQGGDCLADVGSRRCRQADGPSRNIGWDCGEDESARRR
jgi:hypothetical protein